MSTCLMPDAPSIVAHQGISQIDADTGDRQAFKGLYNGDMKDPSKLRAQF